MVNVRVTRMAREQIATLLHAGSTPVAYSKIPFLLFVKVAFD